MESKVANEMSKKLAEAMKNINDKTDSKEIIEIIKKCVNYDINEKESKG